MPLECISALEAYPWHGELQVLGALSLVFPQTENRVGEIGMCGERRSHGELKLLL